MVKKIVDSIATRQDNAYQLDGMVERHLAYKTEWAAQYIKWIVPGIQIVRVLVGFLSTKRKKS